jgi:hypothetical protein
MKTRLGHVVSAPVDLQRLDVGRHDAVAKLLVEVGAPGDQLELRAGRALAGPAVQVLDAIGAGVERRVLVDLLALQVHLAEQVRGGAVAEDAAQGIEHLLLLRDALGGERGQQYLFHPLELVLPEQFASLERADAEVSIPAAATALAPARARPSAPRG